MAYTQKAKAIRDFIVTQGRRGFAPIRALASRSVDTMAHFLRRGGERVWQLRSRKAA